HFAVVRSRCAGPRGMALLDGHRDASRILPDIFDPDVDAVADARLEPPHDDERPAHGVLVADGDERPWRHLRGVGDRSAQAAAGSAAVLELPELMGDAEFQSRP